MPDMKIKTRFILSAVSPEAFPASPRPEVAFVGRSNVGKSSLINALVGTKMARVSSRPGLTQAINFFEVDVAAVPGLSVSRPGTFFPMMLADLPGYGYAQVSRKESRGWASFIDPYLSARDQLVLVVVLVDSTIPIQPGDMEMVQWLRTMNRPFLIAATKLDKIGPSRRLAETNRLAAGFEARVLGVSATSGDGLEELWKIVLANCKKTQSAKSP
ncbi:MAG TPA: ribosome biogenesis GTP-binding protein YihA/YsxC [Myxococcota bacterium]|nr:ribosome biogenesis GTP-binding protein YihA/YsxC [Myxococcota bacterium]